MLALLGPVLSIITGPIGKWLGIGALVAALAAGLFFAGVHVVHKHDAKVLLEQQNAEQVARIATITADQQKIVGALEEQTARNTALQASLTSTRASINAAPHTKGCTSSAAVSAALDGLRHKAPAVGR